MSTVRERAASVLGISAEASAQEAASAFLESLSNAEYVPSADAVAAVNILADTSIPVDPRELTEPGLSFADQVADFAVRFWSLPPGERTAEWVALGERVTGEDAAAARLFALQPGLEVETEPLLDLDMQELASLARELFVLRPRDRAIRRNEWLLANASRHDHFRRAAKALKQSRPALAALEPTLMARLSIEFGIKTFAKAANRPPIDMPRFTEPIRSHPFGQPEEVQLKQGRREQSQEPASRSLGCGGIWLGIVILGAIRACLSGDSHRSESPPPTLNPEQLRRQLDKARSEQYEKRTIPGPWMRFTEEQVRQFQAFDQDRRGVAPPWYGEWVLAGRPSAREAAPVRPPRVQDDEKEP